MTRPFVIIGLLAVVAGCDEDLPPCPEYPGTNMYGAYTPMDRSACRELTRKECETDGMNWRTGYAGEACYHDAPE